MYGSPSASEAALGNIIDNSHETKEQKHNHNKLKNKMNVMEVV